MAALGWLLNLDFAGSATVPAVVVIETYQIVEARAISRFIEARAINRSVNGARG